MVNNHPDTRPQHQRRSGPLAGSFDHESQSAHPDRRPLRSRCRCHAAAGLPPTTIRRSWSTSRSRRCRSRSAPAGTCAATSAIISTSKRDGDFNFRNFDPVTGTYSPEPSSIPPRSTNRSPGASASATISPTWSAPTPPSTLSRSTSTAPRRARCPACAGSRPLPAPAAARQTVPTRYALSFMVNGYVDLGTYVGLTPYVGGGLGYTYVDWGHARRLRLLRRRRLPGRRCAACPDRA